jgi:hypothetical protein
MVIGIVPHRRDEHRSTAAPGITTGIFYFSTPNKNVVQHNTFRAAGVEEAKKYFRRKGHEPEFMG